MYSLALLSISAILLALALTPMLRSVLVRFDLVDRPDGGRKLHDKPVPKLGGVAVAIAYLAPFGILLASPLVARKLVADHLDHIVQLLPAMLIVFFTGVLDDLKPLRPWQKLIGQTLAASWAYFAGVQITGIAGHAAAHWWSFPMTVAWLVICTNAFNLIDGVDGLAVGIGICTCLTMALAGLMEQNLSLAMACGPLAGALLGFLRYNFNPASIFLGDSGSLLVGFLLGAFGVLWSQKTTTMLGMTAPLVLMSIPLCDTGLAILRRFLRNQPIFSADRNHIHHRLLTRGFTPRSVALLLYAACGITSVASFIISAVSREMSAMVVLLFGLAAAGVVVLLDYPELRALDRLFLKGDLQRFVNMRVALQQFEHSLQFSPSLEDSWNIVRRTCEEWDFCGVHLHFHGVDYRAQFRDSESYPWSVRVRMSQFDYCELEYDGSTRSAILPEMTKILHDNLLIRAKRPTPMVRFTAAGG